ncbi:solute carrier family 2, facilitated glucose transporter member 5-like [Lacerta agilis]|uniref:solute carrier family 2, facilitated glucose transporter member 5-like n=1 Tax=Lacerta agilis TaxID=80427 RepID=UPI001419CBF5|nr:solute carrier family 2, facilitated glucose transporter member 5-like [Lacerta agilis]
MTAGFGSSFQYGYNVFVINYAAEFIKSFYNETYRWRNHISIDHSLLLFQWGLTVSFFPVGGMVGSLLVAPLADNCGRKRTLQVNNILAIISAVLMGCSRAVHSFEFIIFSRLVIGICAGISFSVVPMYLTEIAPENLRGAIAITGHFFIIFGSLMARIFGLDKLLGTQEGWPFLLSLTGVPALFQLIFLPFFPESPRYLLIQRHDEKAAREVLQRLRCQDDVESEIEELHQENVSVRAEKEMNTMKLLCNQGLRWQIISVVILMSGQQLTGVNAVFYYSERIYATLRIKKQEARYITVLSSIFIAISLMIVVYTVDSVGRRILLLTGFGICSILCILLTMTLELQDTMPWMSYVTSVFFLLLIFGHILGPGPIPNVIILELFLQPSRSIAFMLGGFVHWFLHFIMGMIFIQIETRIGSYTFLLFWPLCIFSFVYIFKVIPETNGKTFLEIKKYMLAMAKKVKVQVQVPIRRTSKDKDRRRLTRHSIRSESVRQDSVRQDSIRRDSTRRDSDRRDSGRRDSSRRDSGRRDSSRRDSGRRDSSKRDSSAKRDSTKRKESIKRKRKPTITS